MAHTYTTSHVHTLAPCQCQVDVPNEAYEHAVIVDTNCGQSWRMRVITEDGIPTCWWTGL